MKLLLLSDLHLMWDRPRCRLDENMAQTCLKKMLFILDYAARENCIILQAGDFFDVPRSWHMLVSYMKLLDTYKEVPVYCVFGQHDQYYRTREDTLLVALEVAGQVKVLDRNPVVWGGDENHQVCIYGCGYGEDVPESTGSSDCNVLVIHDNISDQPLWPGHDYTQAKRFLLRNGDFQLILTGDIHKKFLIKIDGRMICNSGALIRGNVIDKEHKPGFWIYDTEDWTIDWVEIPHEPSERCMSRRHLDDAEESSEMLRSFVEAVDDKIEMGESFGDNLSKFIEENGIESVVVDLISEEMSKHGD